MLIDSPAVIATLLDEPETPAIIAAITTDRSWLASAATMLETSMAMLSRKGEAGLSAFRAFAARAAVQVGGFGPDQVDLAADAFRRFGLGRHPAGLDFGDCFSQALAKAADKPMLFKGEDF